MKIISIIGNGNVATHLYRAFNRIAPTLSSLPEVKIINSRTLEGLPEMSDLLLISVKDDAIKDVAERLKGKGKLMAHTSGSVGMEILNGCCDKTGVFYPLQTFSKEKELDYEEIPFFIEGEDEETAGELADYARLISRNVTFADSQQRKQLHISAVFACNFSNHLVALADKLLQENGMDYKLLLPLLKETVKKLETLTPQGAQTGPAVRGDLKILKSHEEMLKDNKEMLEIYRLLSESIRRTKGI